MQLDGLIQKTGLSLYKVRELQLLLLPTHSLILQCEQRRGPNLPVHVLIGRALANVAPSLLLTSCSESAAFLLGAISSMPAVRSYSLYAGVAVFYNFILQVNGMEKG